MNKLTVSSSPHLRAARTTRSVMLEVLLALSPAVVAGCVLFGLRALLVVAVTAAAAVVSEWLFCLATKRPVTVGDCSAAVTGVILGLNLPVTMKLWQACLGAIVAIVVVKCLFGGLGRNFANPALVGRIVLFISFTSSMAAPLTRMGYVDMVTGATPLTLINEGKEAGITLSRLFLGTYGGMIGETCALALLLGGAYLCARKIITWHIPVTYMAVVAVFALCCGRDPLVELCSGGLLLGAIFMATDYVTSPTTPVGKVVFGAGCGLLTMFIRVFCAFPEGTSFALLLMNILTPYIDRLTVQKPIGGAAK